MKLFPAHVPLRLPISIRLALWYGLTLLILLALFAGSSYVAFHTSLHQDFDRHLTHEEHELRPFVEIVDGRPRFTSLDDLRSVAYQTDGIYGTYVRLFSRTGDELYRSPNFEGHPTLPFRLPDEAKVTTVSRNWEGEPARSRYTPLVGTDGTLDGWLEVTGFEWSLHRGLYRLAVVFILGIVASVLLAITGGYLLARRALRPVAALTTAANEIRASDLSSRLPTRFGIRDELTDLTETFNEMIERLESSFIRERRFTSNAAHELLTPLTTMRSGVEVTLRKKRDVETHESMLRTLLVDMEEMSETVQGLLQLSRVERMKELPRTTVDLSEETHTHAERHQDRAARQGIELQCSVQPQVYVQADAVYLGEVIDNLVDNALKYTPEGGTVRVQLETGQGEARLCVSDTGVGFEPEQIGQLFDRFYRADLPEVQARPGSGLGLAIVQAFVEVYGGTISARSPGLHQGATFEVRLPLA